MRQLSIENELELFVEEWLTTLADVRKAIDERDFASIARDTITLPKLTAGNYVNRKGYRILENVAARLLRERQLTLRVSLGTARDILVQCFAQELEKKQRKAFSAAAVIKRAREALTRLELPSGAYVFATQFSFSAKSLKFQFGPVTIVSKARFYRENTAKLRASWEGSEADHSFLLKKWLEHMKRFDHVILVNLTGFERDLGWDIARECAEFSLNIVRTFFQYQYTRRIRLSGDFVLEQNRSSLILENSGIWLSHGTGGVSSFLDDDAMEHFDRELRPLSGLFASFAGWLASGKHQGSPTVERLRYANRLVAEAYCEPSDYLRLVRLVSAFEALAVIRTNDKAHELAVRCGIMGAWGEPAVANEIYDSVRLAYHNRNMVVHGDSPSESAVRNAFFGLERHAFRILVGFLAFFAAIERTVKPKSIRVLAREIRNRIDYYFFDPEFGFD